MRAALRSTPFAVTAAAIVLLAPAPLEATPPATPAELVARVREANGSLTSWRARFLQRRHFVHFNESETRTGRIAVKRGQGLRVDVDEPDSEVIVVHDGKAEQWRPSTRQLHVYRFAAKGGTEPAASPIPFSFASAGWDPGRDHDLRLLPPSDGEIGLEMVPHDAGQAYARKTLWIDPATWLPLRLQLVETTDDTVTFVFSDIERNPKLEDGLFRLEVPAGADVVEHEELPSL
jgi:outer membrane lipoprotein-sorting protein